MVLRAPLGTTPPKSTRGRLRVLFRFARLALLACCHDGPWWALDDWHPRCDPRIPLSAREPQANCGCSPGQITQPWLREAVKWYLGTQLESGALRWSTVSQERLNCLRRFDIWLTRTFDDPTDVLGDPPAPPARRPRTADGPWSRATATPAPVRPADHESRAPAPAQ